VKEAPPTRWLSDMGRSALPRRKGDAARDRNVGSDWQDNEAQEVGLRERVHEKRTTTLSSAADIPRSQCCCHRAVDALPPRAASLPAIRSCEIPAVRRTVSSDAAAHQRKRGTKDRRRVIGSTHINVHRRLHCGQPLSAQGPSERAGRGCPSSLGGF
jgi:hypothetical protein